ncbi:MAG: FAD-binding oxidoreductase [Roseomonas sp.]|nr:FAD-binding oxidoreductase [Roseomonas sp.]MCA3327767.1 FAD-binding oxidoreductase [Roseomonas sp.]MCA3331269.1 FAD-binding oxidoreductase [Roseomonas sp.]MCA3347987.1 FAD-binding oxidoreductase [Roseomonas sp.]MCA3352869.1 FAD-binding oxidoreductase [Roseomonas sp.]
MARHVVIIGAGAVGAASALAALKEGYRVTILDPGEPGGEQAASYGNGCWLSPMSVIPPAVPGIWKKLPKFLSDPLGPLAIRWGYLPKVAPWLIRYLASGWRWRDVARTAHALRPLVQDAPRLHKALAEQAGVGHLIERRGLIYIYPSRADFEAERKAWDIRHQVGVRWIELDADELRQREPDLDRRYGFAVFVDEGGHCTDPGAYVAALIALAQAEGAKLLRDYATGFRIEAGRLRAVTTGQGEVACDAAVIAAGVHSKPLARAAGDDVPLESERGYHAEINAPEVAPRHGLMPSDGKMSIMRTARGLRCAGQVEIAGIAAAPNWQRAEILKNHLLSCFPGLPRDLPADRVKFWLGHRPSMPDGMPCLGPSRATADVIHAFGHGHTGLVAAARTGEVVAALLARRAPPIPIAAFDSRRFKAFF